MRPVAYFRKYNVHKIWIVMINFTEDDSIGTTIRDKGAATKRS